MRKLIFFVIAALVGIIPALVWGYINKDNIDVRFTVVMPETPKIVSDIRFYSVPDFDYDQLFSEEIGYKEWAEAKKLFNKEGLKKFSEGDIFSVTGSDGNLTEYTLHHYEKDGSGRKITFIRKGDIFEKKEENLSISVSSVVKNFQVKTTFSDDFPEFYATAKKYMSWDWYILEMLKPGDSVSFIIKGIFDKDILTHDLGIQGFSVKSRDLGSFTLVAYRDKYYGNFFTPDGSAIFSPQGFFRVPIDYARVTSQYGYRSDPFNGNHKMHKGIDVVAKYLTPVHAARDGVVTHAGWKGGLGRTVIIDHGFGIKTLYGHLGSISVKPKMVVRMGDVVGGAGSSGRSTGTHLHFTVYQNDEPVDPLKFAYERLLVPPFDIAEKFKKDGEEYTAALLESVEYEKTFFLDTQNKSRYVTSVSD